MKKTGVKLTGLFLACTLAIAPAAYVSAEEKGETLVYGSGDYTRINPAMDEHGEINVLIFNPAYILIRQVVADNVNIVFILKAVL